MLTRKLKEAVALAPLPHHRHHLPPHLPPPLLTVLTLKWSRKRGMLSYMRLNLPIRAFLKTIECFWFFFLIFTGSWQTKGEALPHPPPPQMRKRLRKKGMERGAQHSSDVLFLTHLTVVSSQCCKVQQSSCWLAESFSLPQLFSPKIHESGAVLTGSQVSGIGQSIFRRLNQKCTFWRAVVVVLLGAVADSPRATRPTAIEGSEVAAQNVFFFFRSPPQWLVILSNLRLVCTFFYDPSKNRTRPTHENG